MFSQDVILRCVASFAFITSATLFIPGSLVFLILPLFFMIFGMAFLVYPLAGVSVFVANMLASAAVGWYGVLAVTKRNVIDEMPDSFYNVSNVINIVCTVHALLLFMGSFKKMVYFYFTWITMAALILLVTIQHITVSFYMTNG